MKLLFKSKLYQLEIQRWMLTLALLVWGLTASILALQNRKETVLVGIDSLGFARVISTKNDRYVQEELKAFLKEFINRYYSYSDLTFDQQVGAASDLMNQTLWDQKKTELHELRLKILKEPLEQVSNIETLDLINEGQVEGVLNLQVTQKLNKKNFKLKVNLSIKANERNQKNPWGYEVTEVSDVAL